MPADVVPTFGGWMELTRKSPSEKVSPFSVLSHTIRLYQGGECQFGGFFFLGINKRKCRGWEGRRALESLRLPLPQIFD